MYQPLILISNDDGVDAPGFRHLIEAVSDLGDIVAVAPTQHKSGQSSAITFSLPLRMYPYPSIGQAQTFAVDGTPVDCVKLAMHTIFRDRRPDLVLAGINHGSNAAVNSIYSGTMGAAFEGCMCGIPSIAYSLLSHDMNADLSPTTDLIREITAKVLAHGLPQGVCLNVNFPASEKILGMKVLRAARGHWTDEYREYTDPFGRPFFMLTGRFENAEPEAEDTDEYWLARDCASVVPMRTDQSALDCLDLVKDIMK